MIYEIWWCFFCIGTVTLYRVHQWKKKRKDEGKDKYRDKGKDQQFEKGYHEKLFKQGYIDAQRKHGRFVRLGFIEKNS